MNITLTDDDTMVAELLREYLDSCGRIRVVHTGTSGRELLDWLSAATQLPEVALVDLNMQQMDGVVLTEELKRSYPDVYVIVLSSHYKPSFLGFMLRTGVAAFLPKGLSVHELPGIIAAVASGGFYLLPEQVEVLRKQISGRAPAPVVESENALTEREIEVLRLLCLQKTAKEIGDQLFITQRTVEGHKNSLLLKTGVRNTTGLVIYAVQRGIVSADDLPII